MRARRPGRVRPDRGRAPPGADRRGPRSGDGRGAGARSRRPASTGGSGTSWPGSRTRSGWPGSACGRPRTAVRGSEFAGPGRGGRRGRDGAASGRRGLRHRRRVLRRVRGRPGGQGRAQAAEPDLRAGGGRARSPRPPHCRRCATAAQVQAGQRVLVIGASGGVGTFAVQIAKAFGAEVTGVSSTAKLDLVRSLGADRVLDYTADDVTDGAERYDVILDIGGNTPLRRLRRALTPTGTLVIVGGETRRPLAGRPPSAPGHGAVAVRRPEARHVRQLRERRRPRRPHRADRGRPGHPRRRPDVPAGRGAGGRPATCARAGPAARSS